MPLYKAHADEFVGGVGRVAAVLGGRVGDAVGGFGLRGAGGAADDFGDEAAEGELGGIVVDGVVDGGVGGGDVFVLEAGRGVFEGSRCLERGRRDC